MSDELDRHSNECEYCEGKGYFEVPYMDIPGEVKFRKQACEVCEGLGFTVED